MNPWVFGNCGPRACQARVAGLPRHTIPTCQLEACGRQHTTDMFTGCGHGLEDAGGDGHGRSGCPAPNSGLLKKR
jgi:hypothetical protein